METNRDRETKESARVALGVAVVAGSILLAVAALAGPVAKLATPGALHISTRQYEDLEVKISARVRAGTSPEAIRAGYRAQVLKNQADRAAMFGWAFAGVEAHRTAGGAPLEGDWVMEQVLAHDDPGDEPQYTRIRFAVTQEMHPGVVHPEMDRAAEAALRTSPGDAFLRDRLVYDLINDKRNLPKAIEIAGQGIAVNPHDASEHSLLATVYQTAYMVGRHQADAQSAVDELRKYLVLAAPGDPYRHNAQYLIGTISKMAALKS